MSQGLATYTGLDFLNFLQILASSFVACAQVLKTGKQKLVLFVAQGARGAGDGSLSSATAGDDALSLGGGDDGGPDDGTGGSIEGGESSSSSSRRVSFADGNGTSRGGGDGRSGCSGSGGSSSSRKLNLGVDDFAFRIAKAREAFETGAAARVSWLDDHLLRLADKVVDGTDEPPMNNSGSGSSSGGNDGNGHSGEVGGGGGGGGGGGAKAKAMNKNPFLSWSDKELLVASTCFVELELPTFTHPVIHEERRYHVSSPRIFHTCMHRS